MTAAGVHRTDTNGQTVTMHDGGNRLDEPAGVLAGDCLGNGRDIAVTTDDQSRGTDLAHRVFAGQERTPKARPSPQGRRFENASVEAC